MRENIQGNMEDNIYELHENIHEIQQNIHDSLQENIKENIKENIQELQNGKSNVQYARQIAGGMCFLIGTLLAIYVGGWLMIVAPLKELLNAFLLGKLTKELIVISTIKCALSLTAGSAIWCGGYILRNKMIGYEE